MRILFIGPNYEHRYNRGHWLFQVELACQAEVVFWGPGWPGFEQTTGSIESVVLNARPDLILTWHAKKLGPWFEGLGEVPLHYKRAHIIVDYDDRAGRTRGHHALWDRDQYDLLIARTKYEYDLARANRPERVIYIPYSVDPAVFTDPGLDRGWDVACIGADNPSAYPNRRAVMDYVKSLPRTLTGFISGPSTSRPLQQSKIFVVALGDKKTIPQKWLEAAACGALLLTEAADDPENQGWISTHNCVIFDGLYDLSEKSIICWVQTVTDAK